MILSLLTRKAAAFLRRPAFVQIWFLPVLLLLGLSKLLILLFSFRRLAPRLGSHAGVTPWLPVLDERQASRAAEIGQVVRLAARYTPWDTNCFPQAVAARLLLGLYGIPYALFFGLARDPDSTQMTAHAWVAAGRVCVTGGVSFGQFAVVGCFVSPLLNGVIES